MSNSRRGDDELAERLRELARSHGDSGVWRVVRLDASNAGERAELARLAARDVMACFDTIRDQMRESIASAVPSRKLRGSELDDAVADRLGGDPTSFGTWIYYPWSRRLVHVLPEREYRRLRADRNRYKITPDEASTLHGATIGVVGLSVGQSAAITCALEGVGGAFRLADFDALSLSNLNRLRAGTHELGIPKVVIAARALAEIDPYLDIAIAPEGITAETLDAFLDGPPRLDLLIEECDDLVMKVRLRERCRALGIPVVMDTSDRGLLDIERFDREPSRPVFHGLVGDIRANELTGLSTRDKLPFMLDVLDADRLSPRLGASLVEIDETITTWPQLASGVALGGALIADAARRILLGQLTRSGRYYVDLEELVHDGASSLAILRQEPRAEPPAAMSSSPTTIARCDASIGSLRELLSWAILAPSGGNCQPWRFAIAPNVIECRRDPSRMQAFLDRHGGTHLALGAAVENIELAAAAAGLAIGVHVCPDRDDPDLVCRVSVLPDRVRESAAARLALVAARTTNRRCGDGRRLSDADRDGLLAVVPEGTVVLVRDGEELHEVAQQMGVADQIAFLCASLHREITSEFRWTAREALERRDGLDIDTLELSPADRAAMRILMRWPIMDALAQIGEGRALQAPTRKAVASSAAVAVIRSPSTGPDAFFAAGRVMQRLWLEATARSIAVHPMTAAANLIAELESGDGSLFSTTERARVVALRDRWRHVFPLTAGSCEPMILRLAYASPPSARSVRRHLDAVVEDRSGT